jgi:hypothetical protein
MFTLLFKPNHDNGYISLRPQTPLGECNYNTWTPTSSFTWSPWYDITNDTNFIYPLSWFGLKNSVNMRVYGECPSDRSYVYVGKVQMRTFYVNHKPNVTDINPSNWSNCWNKTDKINFTINDPEGRDINYNSTIYSMPSLTKVSNISGTGGDGSLIEHDISDLDNNTIYKWIIKTNDTFTGENGNTTILYFGTSCTYSCSCPDIDESMDNSKIVNLTLNNESWVNVNISSWFNDTNPDTLEMNVKIVNQSINNTVDIDNDESMSLSTNFNFTLGSFWHNFTLQSWFNDTNPDTLEHNYIHNNNSTCQIGGCSGIVWVNYSDNNVTFNVSVNKADDSNTSTYSINENFWLLIQGFSFENETLSILLTLSLFIFFFSEGYRTDKKSGGLLMLFSGFMFIGLEFLISSYLNNLYVVPLLTPFSILFMLLGIKKAFYNDNNKDSD